MVVEKEEVDIAIKRANDLNFSVNESPYSIFIKTNKSSWWIDYSNKDNIKLWHKNMRISTKKNKKFNEDYHLQRGHFKRIIFAVNYIYKHDNDKYTNHEKSRNKKYNDRLDKIFNKISKK